MSILFKTRKTGLDTGTGEEGGGLSIPGAKLRIFCRKKTFLPEKITRGRFWEIPPPPTRILPEKTYLCARKHQTFTMQHSDTLARLNITSLTPMQEATAQAWTTGRDLILLSPTGTGKTLAFLLPLAAELREDTPGVQALVLSPSRELAQQTARVFADMKTPLRALCCHGGRPTMDEHRLMRQTNPALIVATPGRLADHLRKGNFDTRHVHTLVIDEFDKCLELGFQEEMEEIIRLLPAVRRRVLLSATDAATLPHFVRPAQDPDAAALRLDFLPAADTDNRLTLRIIPSADKDKLETLFRLLCTLGTSPTLVFANHRESVERIARYLRERRFPAAPFHGGMEQDNRERALYKFRNGTTPVLICTDLAARGLDIDSVQNIVHYHLPTQADAFTHRNGRTARWDARGTAYLILHTAETRPDWLPPHIPTTDLPATTPPIPQPQWATLYIGKGKRDRLSRADVAGFLGKKAGLGRDDLGRIDILPHFALAAIRRNRLQQTLRLVQGEKIKGMHTRIEQAK